MQDSFHAFREKLDSEHSWPDYYVFKFVVPKNKVEEFRVLFSDEQLTEKQSKAGNYTSFTIKKMISSSDEVIEAYVKAKKVEGIISL